MLLLLVLLLLSGSLVSLWLFCQSESSATLSGRLARKRNVTALWWPDLEGGWRPRLDGCEQISVPRTTMLADRRLLVGMAVSCRVVS